MSVFGKLLLVAQATRLCRPATSVFRLVGTSRCDVRAACSGAKASRKPSGPCEPFRRCTRRGCRSATTATAKHILRFADQGPFAAFQAVQVSRLTICATLNKYVPYGTTIRRTFGRAISLQFLVRRSQGVRPLFARADSRIRSSRRQEALFHW